MTTVSDNFLHELEQAASQPPPIQAPPPPRVRVKKPKVATVAPED